MEIVDPIVRKYEAGRKGPIGAIFRKLTTHGPRDSKEAAQAIVVMVKPLAHANWWDILRQLKSIVDHKVEFVVGSCQPLSPKVAILPILLLPFLTTLFVIPLAGFPAYVEFPCC